jgi:hypothetical protein
MTEYYINRVINLFWRVTFALSITISLISVLIFEHLRHNLISNNSYVSLTEFLVGFCDFFFWFLVISFFMTITKRFFKNNLTQIQRFRRFYLNLRYSKNKPQGE